MSNLWPSLWSGANEIDPFRSIGKEIYDVFNRVTRQLPNLPTALDFGNTAPALNVAETKDAIEVSAEVPGMDEKDVNVTIEGNRLVIAGERKHESGHGRGREHSHESEHKEKDWHVTETSYGTFRRSVLLPFEPANNAVEARFEKGMLRMTIKKPAEAIASKRVIEIKPETKPAAETKAQSKAA